MDRGGGRTSESAIDNFDRSLKLRMLQFEQRSLVRHVVQVLRGTEIADQSQAPLLPKQRLPVVQPCDAVADKECTRQSRTGPPHLDHADRVAESPRGLIRIPQVLQRSDFSPLRLDRRRYLANLALGFRLDVLEVRDGFRRGCKLGLTELRAEKKRGSRQPRVRERRAQRIGHRGLEGGEDSPCHARRGTPRRGGRAGARTRP